MYFLYFRFFTYPPTPLDDICWESGNTADTHTAGSTTSSTASDGQGLGLLSAVFSCFCSGRERKAGHIRQVETIGRMQWLSGLCYTPTGLGCCDSEHCHLPARHLVGQIDGLGQLRRINTRYFRGNAAWVEAP